MRALRKGSYKLFIWESCVFMHSFMDSFLPNIRKNNWVKKQLVFCKNSHLEEVWMQKKIFQKILKTNSITLPKNDSTLIGSKLPVNTN